MGCAPVSAAKADSSSPELVRDVTSSSVSLVEMLTTLLEDALALPLDFLFVTVVHYFAFDNVRMDPHCLSSRSRNRNKTLLLLVMRISIDHS